MLNTNQKKTLYKIILSSLDFPDFKDETTLMNTIWSFQLLIKNEFLVIQEKHYSNFVGGDEEATIFNLMTGNESNKYAFFKRLFFSINEFEHYLTMVLLQSMLQEFHH